MLQTATCGAPPKPTPHGKNKCRQQAVALLSCRRLVSVESAAAQTLLVIWCRAVFLSSLGVAADLALREVPSARRNFFCVMLVTWCRSVFLRTGVGAACAEKCTCTCRLSPPPRRGFDLLRSASPDRWCQSLGKKDTRGLASCLLEPTCRQRALLRLLLCRCGCWGILRSHSHGFAGEHTHVLVAELFHDICKHWPCELCSMSPPV